MAYFADSTEAPRVQSKPIQSVLFSRGVESSSREDQSEKTGGYIPNKYAGRCTLCSAWVPERAGEVLKTYDGWLLIHRDGQCLPDEDDTRTLAAFSVPDGSYKVGSKHLRVKRQDEFDDFMPGRALIGYMKPGGGYTNFAHVNDEGMVCIWKKYTTNKDLQEAVHLLIADPKEAAIRFARETGTCGICHRTLTTEESVARGMGPKCAERFQW